MQYASRDTQTPATAHRRLAAYLSLEAPAVQESSTPSQRPARYGQRASPKG